MEMMKLNVDFNNQTVSARELYESVGSTERFSNWFERQLQYGFIDGEDFTSVKSFTLVNNGAERELQDYQLTLDMAKQICMVQRTEKAKQIRQYLIDLERKWNTPAQIMARALRVADETIKSLEAKISEQKPLVEYAERVSQSADTIGMSQMAKLACDEGINIGRNRLVKFLKDNKILMNDNTPYQQYIDRGYFEVVKAEKKTVYGQMYFPTTVITGKGQIWIINKLKKED